MFLSAVLRRLGAGHGHDDHDDDGESAVLARIVSIGVLLVVAFGGYCSALLVRENPRRANILGAMAAGVMISGGVVHLIPESTEDLSDFQDDNMDGFPLAGLLAGTSFVLLVAMEKLVQSYLTQKGKAYNVEGNMDVVAQPASASVDSDDCRTRDDHDHSVGHLNGESYGKAMLVSLAISFHAVMTGLALGSSSASSTWKLLGAVAFHKILESVALGAAILRAGIASKSFFLYGALFSICTPIGIGIGWVSANGGDGVGSGICTALAAGTFVWVATAEFLPQSFKDEEDTVLKIAALWTGFAAMSVLAIWH